MCPKMKPDIIKGLIGTCCCVAVENIYCTTGSLYIWLTSCGAPCFFHTLRKLIFKLFLKHGRLKQFREIISKVRYCLALLGRLSVYTIYNPFHIPTMPSNFWRLLPFKCSSWFPDCISHWRMLECLAHPRDRIAVKGGGRNLPNRPWGKKRRSKTWLLFLSL